MKARTFAVPAPGPGDDAIVTIKTRQESSKVCAPRDSYRPQAADLLHPRSLIRRHCILSREGQKTPTTSGSQMVRLPSNQRQSCQISVW
jgi:hypothetical protein